MRHCVTMWRCGARRNRTASSTMRSVCGEPHGGPHEKLAVKKSKIRVFHPTLPFKSGFGLNTIYMKKRKSKKVGRLVARGPTKEHFITIILCVGQAGIEPASTLTPIHVALLPFHDLLQIVSDLYPVFCYSISIALFLHLFHILGDWIFFQREKEKDAFDECVHVFNKKPPEPHGGGGRSYCDYYNWYMKLCCPGSGIEPHKRTIAGCSFGPHGRKQSRFNEF